MSIIELFWHLNVTDNTKYLIFISMIICVLIMCMMNGKKKFTKIKKNASTGKIKKLNKLKKHNVDLDREYIDYFMKQSPTKCQSNYIQCTENNILNKKNEFCYPCMHNGNYPNFFYNPDINQWVKLS